MLCPICHKHALSISQTARYHRIKCSGCGEYKLTGTLEMALTDYLLDVESSRDRLMQYRAGTPVPALTAYDSDLLRPRRVISQDGNATRPLQPGLHETASRQPLLKSGWACESLPSAVDSTGERNTLNPA